MFYYLHHSQPEILLLVALISPSFYFTCRFVCVMYFQVFLCFFMFLHLYYIIFSRESKLLCLLIIINLYPPDQPTVPFKPHPHNRTHTHTHTLVILLYLVIYFKRFNITYMTNYLYLLYYINLFIFIYSFYVNLFYIIYLCYFILFIHFVLKPF